MRLDKNRIKILKILLKNLAVESTITSLAKDLGITRVGTWKAIKRLESEKLIVLSHVGSGKTSVHTISLNWQNPLTEKNLILALTEDAEKNRRWIANFAELDNKVDFLIIFGSALTSPRDANDIDLLGVMHKNRFLEVDEIDKRIQKTQVKKIHILNFTPDEFRQELKKPNKVFIEAIKKGIILFGQEKFIRFIRGVPRK